MWTKVSNFWNGMPHWLQALAVLFAGTAAKAVATAVSAPNACMTLACWRQYLSSGLDAGVAAVAGLYVKSSFYKS
jgi:hypothetical protein